MVDNTIDIAEIAKKCKILLLDIEGTTTSITFVKDKLFPYAEENLKQFLDSQWEASEVKEAVAALRTLAIEDQEKKVEGAVAIPADDASKEEQIDGVVKNVKWQMSSDRKATALKQLQGLVWKQGYDNGDIKGHVYDDVAPALEQWRSVEGRKVYIYSSGSVAAQKLLFAQSTAGDLLPHIDGHFDTAVGPKQEDASYAHIVDKIGCKADEILFLTDIEKEAECARMAGLHTALVSREGNAPLSEGAGVYPLLQSFAQLAATANAATTVTATKRKTEPAPQDENPPKVAKTATDDDVKISSTENVTASDTPKPESMDVEETVSKKEVDAPKATEAKEDSAMQVDTAIEETTEPTVKVEEPVCDAKPVAEEKADVAADTDKEKEKEKDKASPAADAPELSNGQQSPADEQSETKQTVLTEIKDITGDQEAIDDVGDIMDNLEPVVEEPESDSADAADAAMAELQNVGEVLEKECDEILSKVTNVTNLESIAVKPLLNPIVEENADADSNDIVDRILDTELEFDMKQCESIDDAVATLTDTKADETVDAGAKLEAADAPAETEKQTPADDDKPAAEQPKETETAANLETVTEETRVNGNATNGDADASVNGDDVNSRLVVENGNKEAAKVTVNGSGDSATAEAVADDKQDAEVPDIKVKSVAPEETKPDPKEQTTEA